MAGGCKLTNGGSCNDAKSRTCFDNAGCLDVARTVCRVRPSGRPLLLSGCWSGCDWGGCGYSGCGYSSCGWGRLWLLGLRLFELWLGRLWLLGLRLLDLLHLRLRVQLLLVGWRIKIAASRPCRHRTPCPFPRTAEVVPPAPHPAPAASTQPKQPETPPAVSEKPRQSTAERTPLTPPPAMPSEPVEPAAPHPAMPAAAGDIPAAPGGMPTLAPPESPAAPAEKAASPPAAKPTGFPTTTDKESLSSSDRSRAQALDRRQRPAPGESTTGGF